MGNGQRQKKKSTIVGEKEQGGLKMIDLDIMNKALKLAWIPRLQSRSHASWEVIPDASLENLRGKSFLSQCNYDVKFVQFNNIPDFYLTNRFHVAVRLFSNRSQMTSKCSKNKKVTHEVIIECVTDVILFVIYDTIRIVLPFKD